MFGNFLKKTLASLDCFLARHVDLIAETTDKCAKKGQHGHRAHSVKKHFKNDSLKAFNIVELIRICERT